MNNQNKLISATKPALRIPSAKYDRSWADLHGLPKQSTQGRPLTLKAIGFVNKQNLPMRFGKAIALFLSTRYSWSTSWNIAAR